jgi:hypothetical protein
MVPGIDGVGRTSDGDLLYFVALDNAVGTMAERAVVDRRRAVVLPALATLITSGDLAINPHPSRSPRSNQPGRSPHPPPTEWY